MRWSWTVKNSRWKSWRLIKARFPPLSKWAPFPELLLAGHGKCVGGRVAKQRRGGLSTRHLGKWRSTVKWLICQQNPRQIFKDQELQDEAQGWECTRKKRNKQIAEECNQIREWERRSLAMRSLINDKSSRYSDKWIFLFLSSSFIIYWAAYMCSCVVLLCFKESNWR